MPKRTKFNAAQFGKVVGANSKTIREILEMHKKGLIHENDQLFTLEAVINISYACFKGGWYNCGLQDNVKPKWSCENGTTQARKYIKEAF